MTFTICVAKTTTPALRPSELLSTRSCINANALVAQRKCPIVEHSISTFTEFLGIPDLSEVGVDSIAHDLG
jgi:hypothetical protein